MHSTVALKAKEKCTERNNLMRTEVSGYEHVLLEMVSISAEYHDSYRIEYLCSLLDFES